MTRKAIKRLIFVAGLTLLLAVGIVLPLYAAPLESMAFLGMQDAASQVTATVTIAITTPVTLLEPTSTLTPTSSPPPPTPTDSPIPPTPTTELPTATLEQPPTPIPPPSPIPTFTPTATPPPSSIDQMKALLTKNWFWAALICLVPLLIAGLAIILWTLRKKPEPTLPPPPSPPPEKVIPYLKVINVPGKPLCFDLKPDGVTIGRAPENDLIITQEFSGWESVSRRHARIYEQAGRWIVEDLGSMNGIYVNDSRTGRNLLRDGWRLDIGGVEFTFYIGTVEAH